MMQSTEQPKAPALVKIALFVPLLNAGETTRAVEIAKAIRELSTSEGSTSTRTEVRFFAAVFAAKGAVDYQRFITDAGFSIQTIGPGFTKEQWKTVLENEHAGKEFFDESEFDKAVELIRLSAEALKEYEPDIVLHGMSPDGSLAAKLLNIPNINFAPLPMTKEWTKVHLLDDIPEADRHWCLSIMPHFLRRALLQHLAFNPKLPTTMAQPTLRRAALECGWQKQGDGNLLDIVSSYETLIVDLPSNYKKDELSNTTFVTGPIFCQAESRKNIDISPEVREVFEPNAVNKVFVSMGSSGEKDYLCEVAKALCSSSKFRAVIVVNPSICSLAQVQQYVAGTIPQNVFMTDKFLPAHVINAMANVAIIHGGQGTVQTAMASGTPVVGIAFQGEQQFNLDCVVQRGAGVCLPKQNWKEEKIVNALEQVLRDPSYTNEARAAQKEMEAINGSENAAQRILAFALKATNKRL